MTTQQFSARLQSKLEESSKFWRTKPGEHHNLISVVMDEVADCIRHALVEPKPPYKKRTNRRKKK